MTSHNRNSIRRYNTFIGKQYAAEDRYEAEAANIRLFREAGFLVPTIIKSDRNHLTHEIGLCRGDVSHSISYENIIRCANVLRRIYVIFSNCYDNRAVAEKYVAGLESAIQLFAKESELVIDEVILKKSLEILLDNFRTTLFKDAKPTNWVVTSESITMLDFDYVRPSFYLADLTQLLNYSPHLTEVQKNTIVDYYTANDAISEDTVRLLFLLSSINSYLMANKYGPDKDVTLRANFDESIIKYLVELEIVNA